ncbi:MAG: SpoIID/LytB domain-containing protein [wastewater metagenome]|nr:SpoIID/LytB domain-containing protein [Candidatus Loosdrechtia aerotolerans]
MLRVFFLMITALMTFLSSGVPLSCQRGIPEVQDGVYNYKDLLEAEPSIRILIAKDTRYAHLAIHGYYQIRDDRNTIVDEGPGLQKSMISVKDDCITVGNRHYKNTEIRISSSQHGDIEVNDVRYPGEIRILRQPNNKFLVIEEVGLENYLVSVVGNEMPHSWNEEALRAQAITARTYAMYKRKVKEDNIYHLDMLDLAYRGITGKTSRISRIVQETRGIVMAYNWNLFPAYFHSTCGGHTEDCYYVFGEDSIPPLKGVVCNYCEDSKYFNWSVDIDKSEIEKKLKDANMYVPDIHMINGVDPGEGIHCSKVEIVSSSGSREMHANSFRLLIGPYYLYSTAFYSRDNGKSITFSGKGLGHGVGLCQYGAQGMAKNSFTCISILKYYYPQVELIRVY